MDKRVFEVAVLGGVISVEVIRKRIRSFRLRVLPGGIVKLSAPLSAPDWLIRKLLSDKSEWISRAFDRLRIADMPGEGHINSTALPEEVSLLGRMFKIEVISSAERSVEAKEGVIRILTTDAGDLAAVAAQLERWLRVEALVAFEAACKRYFPIFERMGFTMPEVKVRKMKACWGVCRPASNTITFDFGLIYESDAFVDYIALHELTHLKYPHHQSDFGRFLDDHMPDWRERRRLTRRGLQQGR